MKPEVTVGLLPLLLLPVSPGPLGPRIMVSCCLGVSSTPVPVQNIIDVTESPRSCKTKAIIVKTKLRVLCLDPEWKWAKDRLKEKKSQRL